MDVHFRTMSWKFHLKIFPIGQFLTKSIEIIYLFVSVFCPILINDTISLDSCYVKLIKRKNIFYQSFCHSQDLNVKLIMIKSEKIPVIRH